MTTEKFVSPEPPPSDYERELLTIFIEECAEAQKRATKILRFGLKEVQPGKTLTNSERLGHEVGNVAEMIHRLLDAGIIRSGDIASGREDKKRQLAIYMQTEKAHANR